jgi:FG-GAP-like repeat
MSPWKFTDVTAEARVHEPLSSFPAWFWDYDNDGWQDLMVTGYAIRNVGDIAADYLGLDHPAEKARLYHNNHDGTFTDVTAKMGVAKVLYAMGVNFGDLDNDGWLDFYIGTGDPDLSTIVPEIGLGRALGIRAVEIFWPATARTQTITGLQMDRFYIVREDANTALAWKPKKFPLAQSPELRR